MVKSFSEMFKGIRIGNNFFLKFSLRIINRLFIRYNQGFQRLMLIEDISEKVLVLYKEKNHRRHIFCIQYIEHVTETEFGINQFDFRSFLPVILSVDYLEVVVSEGILILFLFQVDTSQQPLKYSCFHRRNVIKYKTCNDIEIHLSKNVNLLK